MTALDEILRHPAVGNGVLCHAGEDGGRVGLSPLLGIGIGIRGDHGAVFVVADLVALLLEVCGTLHMG